MIKRLYSRIMDLEPGTGGAWFWVQFFAPFFLVGVSLFRSYVETSFFDIPPKFSFYVAAHQVLWFVCVMMTMVFMMHLASGIRPQRLLWVFYGIVSVLGAPLYAWVTHSHMALEYHIGPPLLILRDVLTFSLLQPHNVPVGLEGLIITAGVCAISYFLTRRWKRTLVMTLLAIGIVNLYATLWFVPEGHTEGFVRVATSLSIQPFLTLVYVLVFSLLTVLYLIRAGAMKRGRGAWMVSAAAGAAAWCAFVALSLARGWYHTPFDLAALGLAVGFAAALGTRMALWRWAAPSPWPVAVLSAVLFVQFAVSAPIWMGFEEKLGPRPVPGRLVFAPNTPKHALIRPLEYPHLFGFAGPTTSAGQEK
ncbi:MAG: hypothetical protein JRI97_05910 [Deltaproteobacteria bacterium]|nr:hypothetical protein [Deltaproteobacteria bacterium]